jgi:hypothetical protein
VVRAENRQISRTRNTGARAAAGEVLVFVDADTCIDAALVRAALAAIDRGAVGGGAGVRFDGRVPFWANITLELFLLGFRLLRLTGGCFLFCTRRAYEEVGGWDEEIFAGEEIVMCRALGRLGRFVILRNRVLTSGRKLRTHSAREILGLFLRAAVSGRKMMRNREGLDLWYAPRREEKERA